MRKKPTKSQVIQWKFRAFEKNWDKTYIQKTLEGLFVYLPNQFLEFNDWDEIAMFLDLPNKAIAQYCLIRVSQDDPQLIFIQKEGKIYIEYLPF